jgi:hypothetical protein
MSQGQTLSLRLTVGVIVVIIITKTWSLMLREEHKLRVFENRELGRIFGSKRAEVTGGWRKSA